MNSIKVLGICGSPRKNKSSRFELEVALEAAENTAPDLVQTELYSFSGKTFHPCDACFQCMKLGHCRKVDDDFAELRDKWMAADVVIYSAPVYHMGIPAQLKAFIDRLGHSVQEGFDNRQMRVIGVLTSGSGFATGQESVMMFLNNHAIMMGCIPVAGLYPVGYIGVGARVDYESHMREEYAAGNVHTIEAIEAIRELGKQLILVTMLLKSGAEQHRELLEKHGGYDLFLQRLAIG